MSEPCGYCKCGCGEKTRIATQTRRAKGHVKSLPLDYIAGHQSRGRSRPIEERFWAKVDKRGPDECWPWLAATTGGGKLGYGALSTGVGLPLTYAHRLSYQIHTGDDPGSLEVCHSCDNSLCVNPAHLFLRTHAENMQDASHKGIWGRCKLTPQEAATIRAGFRGLRGEQMALAREYGVSPSVISRLVNDKTYSPNTTIR